MHDVEIPVIDGILKSNARHIEAAVNMIVSSGRKPVGLAGLSFKAGTDDLRESPHVTLAERLIGKGWNLRIYDPRVRLAQLTGSNRAYIEKTIPHMASLLCDDARDLISFAEVIVVAHADDHFFDCLYSQCRPEHQVIDLDGAVDSARLACKYHAISW
jgi:GDP-mannose 6-dehydrogenase